MSDTARRLLEVEHEILARTPETNVDPSLDTGSFHRSTSRTSLPMRSAVGP